MDQPQDQQPVQQPSETQPPAAGQPRSLLYFVHWHRAGAVEHAQQLGSLGYDVRYDYSYNKDELERAVDRVLALKPDAIVMSLDEFPGYTRSFALGLQARSGLKQLPRLIVGGESSQVEQTKQRLPEIAYSGWDQLAETLSTTLGKQPLAATAHPLPDVKAFL